MKILMVNKFLYPNGGSETYIFKLGEELRRQRHEVQYFGMEHEGRVVGNDAGIYTTSMDFHTGRLQKLLYPFKIIYSKEAYKKMYALMDDFRPDVVHLNNFNFQLTPSIIYAARDWEKKNDHMVKVVYTAHDSQLVCPNHLMQLPSGKTCFECKGGCFGKCVRNRCIHGSFAKSLIGAFEAHYYLRRKTYDMIDLIICPSDFIRHKLETYPLWKKGSGHTKLVTMHNFMDKAKMSYSGETISKDDYVLYFGRYSEEKGVRTLLDVCDSLPETEFRFAGNGPLKDMVQSRENITDLGFLNGEELVNAISRALMVVFPSECYENCPFTVMESQTYGTPVIASDIGGVPELVKDGVTGELFRPGDSKDLRDHIKGLLANKEKLTQYTKNCDNIGFTDIKGYVEEYISLMNDGIDT